jgi:hypothetical protein
MSIAGSVSNLFVLIGHGGGMGGTCRGECRGEKTILVQNGLGRITGFFLAKFQGQVEGLICKNTTHIGVSRFKMYICAKHHHVHSIRSHVLDG